MNTVSIRNDFSLENFSQIDVEIDPRHGIVWVYQKSSPRPCFNPQLISEVRRLQLMLETYHGCLPYQGELVPIHYHVLDSRAPGIYSMGGDLKLFRDHIIRKDKAGLLKYAKSCIDTIHSFIVGFRLPITTISLVRGDALGGGFEVALSGQVVIAERQVEMGFPEILFNIFPGMGGYHLLSQRLHPGQVEKMMLNGRKYTSEELYKMGAIDVLAEKNEGKEAVYNYVEKHEKYRNGYLAMQNVRNKVHPISYEELMDVCSYWVDVAMEISERDLKLMQRLANAQDNMVDTQNQKLFDGNIAYIK
ncbi:MAG: DSF synthase [Planctomycetota bacterium]|jgi:DSF synthase